ncbi:formate C-acetyltransferase [Facklamia languida]
MELAEKTPAMKAWEGFKPGVWMEGIDTQDFIHQNYKEYVGDASFLADATPATKELWQEVVELKEQEQANGGVLDAETKIVSRINAYDAAYLDKDLEKIVGFQTDKPLKRTLNVYGGLRMAKSALQSYGYELDPEIEKFFSIHRKTHNQGVFDVYDKDIKAARHNKLLTGLPDAYGRGRIIADYRRIALYGVDFLIEQKVQDWQDLEADTYTEEDIRLREEIYDQYRALGELKELAAKYGYDISKPATTAQEAIQWVYFGILATNKEDNGAAQSLGRLDAFFDIYIERDMERGILDEAGAQELVDHFVMKLRLIRQMRTEEYDALFSGDPVWLTMTIAGMKDDQQSLVTKTDFRVLNTLYTIGNAPEPNMTIFWSKQLPQGFKQFATQVSIDTSAIQYENDDVMREYYDSSDVSIACCVSPTAGNTGDSMQFFGARASMPKMLLYAVSGGVDEKTRRKVIPGLEPIEGDYLDYDELMAKLDIVMDWVAKTYVRSLNIIHYMHDKYAYEAIQFALMSTKLHRMMATGIAGISLSADSISAVKYAKVRIIRDEDGFPVDYVVEGDQFPTFGNNDPQADEIATGLVKQFVDKLKTQPTYRDSEITTSLLTITSNIVYGEALGALFTGQDSQYAGYRKAYTPLSPGANPSYTATNKGALASLMSLAKFDFEDVKDGTSYTWAVSPKTLGKEQASQIDNLSHLLDGYFANNGGHHLNVNVHTKEELLDVLDHPEKYPQYTIRVSGYALEIAKATPAQIEDIKHRIIHDSI